MCLPLFILKINSRLPVDLLAENYCISQYVIEYAYILYAFKYSDINYRICNQYAYYSYDIYF